MPITDLLARNAAQYPNDIALVEINPQSLEDHHVTWKEYSLIERSPVDSFRSEITWGEFDRRANRFANLLLTRGLGKGKRVAVYTAELNEQILGVNTPEQLALTERYLCRE